MQMSYLTMLRGDSSFVLKINMMLEHLRKYIWEYTTGIYHSVSMFGYGKGCTVSNDLGLEVYLKVFKESKFSSKSLLSSRFCAIMEDNAWLSRRVSA